MLWIVILSSFMLLQPCSSFQSSNSVSFVARDGKGWGSDSSKFFDIALTALAFLSFGIFLLNLLLNALLFPPAFATAPLTNPDPILTMLTAGGGGTGGAIITGVTGIGRGLRSRRAIFSPEVDQITSWNNLIYFVTNSIEKMVQKHECVPRVFCDGNRQSRIMRSEFKVLFPFISVGISIIGRILGLHDEFPTHLKAIRLGITEDNCQSHFPSKCHR